MAYLKLPSLNNSQLPNSDQLEVYPKDIYFYDIKPKNTYEITMTIKNNMSKSCRIRVYQPSSSQFRCDYDIQGPIAPGLCVKVIISFNTSVVNDYHDSIKIISENNFSLVVPIHALQPSCHFVFDNVVNFGFIHPENQVSHFLRVQNQGKQKGKIVMCLTESYLELMIINNTLELEPGQSGEIEFQFYAKESGVFRGEVDVKIEGAYGSDTILQVMATCVQREIYIIDQKGNKVENVDFSQVFVGSTKKMKYYLVNNTPNPISYRTTLREGLLQDKDQFNLITPNELGREQSQAVVHYEPEEGYIDKYSQKPIYFTYQAQVLDKHYAEVRQYINMQAMKNFDTNGENFTYTIIFQMQKDEPFMISCVGQSCIPQLKLSQRVFEFGECSINDKRVMKFQIQNKNQNLPISIDFQKCGYFEITPKSIYLEPNQQLEQNCIYTPQGLGRFDVDIIMNLFDQYQIPINCQGTSHNIRKTKKLRKSILQYPKRELSLQESVIDNSQVEIFKRNQSFVGTDRVQSLEKSLEKYKYPGNKDNFDSFISKMKSFSQANSYLQNSIVMKQKMKMNQITKKQIEKIKQRMLPSKINVEEHEVNSNDFNYEDYDLMLGGLVKEPSFSKSVVKGKNESFSIQNQQQEILKNIVLDPLKKPERQYPSIPTSPQDIHDSQRSLNTADLQNIQAGPSSLNFGSIFVQSLEQQTFWVRNNTKYTIFVQLKTDDSHFVDTNNYSQVIPSGHTAGFLIKVCSQELLQFQSQIRYIINYKHQFMFQVQAQIDPVKLQLSKNKIKFAFSDDNLEFETTEVVRINNNGNARAYFRWLQAVGDNKLFKVKTSEGWVEKQSFVDVNIVYTPNQQSGMGKIDEEKITLQVKDGHDLFLHLQGHLSEFRCAFTQDSIDLGQISVFKKVEASFFIKNLCKNYSVLHVKSVPPGVEIVPMKSKILQDETKQFRLFLYYTQEEEISSKIVVQPRGLKPMSIPIKFSPKIPKVSILEQKFEFGQLITQGIPGQLPMTISNESDVSASLLLDFRASEFAPGVECMDIVLQETAKKHPNLKHQWSILEQISDEPNDDNPTKQANMEVEMQQDNMSQNSENLQEKNINKDAAQSRYYKISLQAKSKVQFILKFVANDITTYQFQLPIILVGAGSVKSIQRIVTATGIQPRFYLQPQMIEFKKKTINNMDQRVCSYSSFTLCNPNVTPLEWFIDKSQFQEDQIFDINPNQGTLEQYEEIELKASFNPYKAGEFEQTASLYLDGNMNKVHMKIKLKGDGIFPKITFDRREIILPSVPLNVVSRTFFRVINEGYDNFNVKPSFSQDLGYIKLNLNYPDGKNLNISRKKIRVEITYKSDKPQSFTSKLEFTDENSRCYQIFVSGQTDNSLLTNIFYLQRVQNEYKIFENNGQIIIQELTNDDQTSSNIERHDKADQVSTTDSIKENLGYSPISNFYIKKNQRCLLQWINYFNNSFQIKSFPDDLIEANGSHLYDIINYFIGKLPQFKNRILDNYGQLTGGSANEKTLYQKLIAQYEEIIYYLKENGALLNTIRPYYLLSYNDYQLYSRANQEKSNIALNFQKMSQARFTYISNENWMQLIFQIIKIFYFQRINLKMIKNSSLITHPSFQNAEYVFPQSNLYSENELLILLWLEIHSGEQKIINIVDELRSGIKFANILKTFVNSSKLNNILNLKTNINNFDNIKENQSKVLEGLNEIGIQTPLQVDDLVDPTAHDLLLLSSQLLMSLPNYQPQKEPITFECILGESMTKIIELENNSNKSITYQVKYEGSQDFILEDSQIIKVESKSSYKYRIQFQSRISSQQNGRVWFSSKKEGIDQVAGALVFDLQSNIIGRKSIHYWTVSSKLYLLEECKLQISNTFVKSPYEYVEFNVELIHEKQKVNKSHKKVRQKQEQEAEGVSTIQPFWILKNKLRIRKGDTTTFVVQFLPFEMKTHHCKIVFVDPQVGELQHEIIGEVSLPDITAEFKSQEEHYVNQRSFKEFSIQHRNELLFNAFKIHEQRLIQFNKQKEKEELQKLRNNYLDTINFNVTMLPQTSFISFPQFFTTDPVVKKNQKDKSKQNDNEIQKKVDDKEIESMNKFPISINFKNTVANLNCQFLFVSQDKTDIRVFKFSLTILPLPIKTNIEMIAQIGETCTQEIPVINYSNKDWQMKIQIQGPQKVKSQFQTFSGPQRDFQVKANTTNYYPISYTPINLSESTGLLTIQNPYTNDVFEYHLKGIVREPVAQEHIIINTVARTETIRKIVISNQTFRQITYKVETDLDHITGESIFEVQPYTNYTYNLCLCPLVGGIYTGQITFQEKDDPNKFIWYTICINVERQPYSKNLELNCVVRQQLEFMVDIANSLDETIQYEVTMDGDYLSGEEFFELPPKSQGTYKLIFSPLKVGTSHGSMTIYNKQLGEVWYKLKLVGHKSPPMKLPIFKAELGKFIKQEIVLSNPGKKTVETQAQVSNSLNYEVIPNKIIIPPLSSTKVDIHYTPTNIDTIESGDVVIQTKEIGDWKFYLQGYGLNPTDFEDTEVTCPITTELQFGIKFKNPFKENINVNITLEDLNEPKIFTLDLPKKKFILNGLDTLHVPLTFSPKQICKYQAKLTIQGFENLHWIFPIKGFTQTMETDRSFSFKTKARQLFQTQLSFKLTGLDANSIKNQYFNLKVPEEYYDLISDSLNFQVIKNTLKDIDDKLVFNLRFLPQKPAVIPLSLLIQQSQGGAWKYNCLLTSDQPDYDDTITIECNLNESKVVTFSMNNNNRSYSDFNAYFTYDSDPVFSIEPKFGELPPIGKPGQQFQINYTPIQYGQKYKGKLIVETKTYYWNFEVFGTYPQYQPPEALELSKNEINNSKIKINNVLQLGSNSSSLKLM